MITLHLGLGEGDIREYKFESPQELTDFISELDGRVWVATEDGLESEILVTDSLEKVKECIFTDLWSICLSKDSKFHLQEYESFEDAYKVSLDMKEGHDLCYSN